MYTIGIDLGGTNIAAGLVDKSGQITHKASVPTHLERGPEPIIVDMAKLCRTLITQAGVSEDEVENVGIGIPGIANNDTGVVVFCTNLGWHHVPLREIFQRIFNKPLYMENDATVAGLAEAVAGISKDCKNSIFLTLGTGLGGGIVIDGKVYSGSHHVGSELGHMIVVVDGEQCTCGNKGCWERYASGTAIINNGRKAMAKHPESKIAKDADGDPEKVTARIVLDAAKAGDPAAVEVFREYVKYLTAGIVSLINVFDPEIISLGGGVSGAGEFLVKAVREELSKLIFYKDVTYARVEIASLGNDAGIIGAAMMGSRA